MISKLDLTTEDIEHMRTQLADLKVLRTLIEIEVKKPKKPLRKRVSRKYEKVQADYIELIEKYNARNEMLLMSVKIIIFAYEKIVNMKPIKRY